jgi:hypothetical protein
MTDFFGVDYPLYYYELLSDVVVANIKKAIAFAQ